MRPTCHADRRTAKLPTEGADTPPPNLCRKKGETKELKPGMCRLSFCVQKISQKTNQQKKDPKYGWLEVIIGKVLSEPVASPPPFSPCEGGAGVDLGVIRRDDEGVGHPRDERPEAELRLGLCPQLEGPVQPVGGRGGPRWGNLEADVEVADRGGGLPEGKGQQADALGRGGVLRSHWQLQRDQSHGVNHQFGESTI